MSLASTPIDPPELVSIVSSPRQTGPLDSLVAIHFDSPSSRHHGAPAAAREAIRGQRPRLHRHSTVTPFTVTVWSSSGLWFVKLSVREDDRLRIVPKSKIGVGGSLIHFDYGFNVAPCQQKGVGGIAQADRINPAGHVRPVRSPILIPISSETDPRDLGNPERACSDRESPAPLHWKHPGD